MKKTSHLVLVLSGICRQLMQRSVDIEHSTVHLQRHNNDNDNVAAKPRDVACFCGLPTLR